MGFRVICVSSSMDALLVEWLEVIPMERPDATMSDWLISIAITADTRGGRKVGQSWFNIVNTSCRQNSSESYNYMLSCMLSEICGSKNMFVHWYKFARCIQLNYMWIHLFYMRMYGLDTSQGERVSTEQGYGWSSISLKVCTNCILLRLVWRLVIRHTSGNEHEKHKLCIVPQRHCGTGETRSSNCLDVTQWDLAVTMNFNNALQSDDI